MHRWIWRERQRGIEEVGRRWRKWRRGCSPVHIGDLDGIVVIEDEFADPTTGEHFGRDGADTAHTNNHDSKLSDVLVGRGEVLEASAAFVGWGMGGALSTPHSFQRSPCAGEPLGDCGVADRRADEAS